MPISDAASGGPLQPVPANVEAAAESGPIYVNPFINAFELQCWRTDQGVDYGAKFGSKIVAIGNARVVRSTTQSGWPGGGCIQYVLLAGPHKHEEVYVAEFITPLIKAGEYVKCGQTIAVFNKDHTTGVGLETGWIRPGTNEPCSTDTSGAPTVGGIQFNRWLRELHCPTGHDFGPGPSICPCM